MANVLLLEISGVLGWRVWTGHLNHDQGVAISCKLENVIP